MELSICGIVCSDCNFFLNGCDGCKAVQGSTFWAKEYFPNKVCSLYECAVMEKKFEDCSKCSELPCKTFKDLKDPNISEEEHSKSITERVSRLKHDCSDH